MYRPSGSDGDELNLIPRKPKARNAPRITATTVIPSLRTCDRDVARTLPNRPVIVMARRCFQIWNRLPVWRCGVRCRGGTREHASRRRNHAAMAYEDSVSVSLGRDAGRTLALLDTDLG